MIFSGYEISNKTNKRPYFTIVGTLNRVKPFKRSKRIKNNNFGLAVMASVKSNLSWESTAGLKSNTFSRKKNVFTYIRKTSNISVPDQ